MCNKPLPICRSERPARREGDLPFGLFGKRTYSGCTHDGVRKIVLFPPGLHLGLQTFHPYGVMFYGYQVWRFTWWGGHGGPLC